MRQQAKPKTLYPKRQKELRISRTMFILMMIMTMALVYIAFVVTIQSIYCIPMA